MDSKRDAPSSTFQSDTGTAEDGRHLLAFMFTDIVGSTSLKDSLTTAVYLPLLRRHDQMLRQAVTSSGGRLLQDTGDGCFAAFATSSDAVKAALTFQWLMAAEPWPPGRVLSSRVGIHLGEVAETEVSQEGGQKLVGMAVDLASRVMSLAQGGQILMTKAAYNDGRQFLSIHPGDPTAPLKWITHGRYLFKGAAEELEVFEVSLESRSPLRPPPDSEKAHRVVAVGKQMKVDRAPALAPVDRRATVRRRTFVAALTAGAAGIVVVLAWFRPWKATDPPQHAVSSGSNPRSTSQATPSPPLAQVPHDSGPEPVPIMDQAPGRLAIDDTNIECLFFTEGGARLIACGKTFAKIWKAVNNGFAVEIEMRLDGTSMVLDGAPRTLTTELSATLEGKVGWSANHRFLLAGGCLFDLAAPASEPRQIRMPKEPRWNRKRHVVTVSPNGNLAAIAETLTPAREATVAAPDCGATLMSLRDQSVWVRLTGNHTGKISAVAFSPDGSQLITGDDTGLIGVWDITDPAVPRSIEWLQNHKAAIHTVFFCGDANASRLCTQDWDKQTILWEPQALTAGGHREYLHQYSIQRYGGYSAAFDATGRWLAVGYGENQRLFFYDVLKKSEVGQSPRSGSGFRYNSTALSADGQRVVVGTYVGVGSQIVNPYEDNKEFGKVYVWEPGNPRLLLKHVGKTDTISAVAITPDGHRIAAVEDKSVYWWEIG